MNPRYPGSQRSRLPTSAIALLAASVLPHSSALAQSIGTFTSVTPTTQTQLLVYPATHTFQLLVQSNRDKYTGTANFIGTTNDFTGFVGNLMFGNTRSSHEGHLSINHETDPGGVSMLTLNLGVHDALWHVTNIKKVDYTPVVKSVRNCSGTVTPWGTIISSEESYATGDPDANGDGYRDNGWNTEIDPITGAIIDHDGNGTPDKLWAMGRFAHENVVVASDNITVYQGEDGGTGGVYKFVANTAKDLSSGTLYVLKRTTPAATTGSWIQVPNTTQAQRNTTRVLAGPTPAGVGGTNWGGVEDVEIGPDGLIYFAEKGQGRIWRFRDNGTAAGVTGIETYVGPSAMVYPITTSSGVVNEQWRDGIDNLAFDNEGNLWALQDGGRNHIWMIRPGHVNTAAGSKIELFATTPAGGEPTGITFSPDYRYLFISIQHPSTGNSATQPDIAGTSVRWNSHATLVIARKEFMGPAFVGDSRLPVELSGFDVREHNGKVSLAWHTASEVNNAGFEVERSSEIDTTFKRIVSYLNDPSLQGLGTSSTGRSYSYVDDGSQGLLAPGTYRYRLVDVSTDGVRKEHPAKTVRIDAQYNGSTTGAFSMGSITPNPASQNISFTFNLAEPATITLEMYDAAGRQMGVPVRDGQYAAGNQQVEIDINTLAPGAYYLRVTTPWGTRVKEFVVAR